MPVIFSSPPLYTDFIILPKISNPIPDYILNNMKLFPFIGDVLGVIDGSHLLALIEMPCMVTMVPSQPMPWLYVCEMDIRQCLKSEICSLIVLSPYNITKYTVILLPHSTKYKSVGVQNIIINST